MIAHRLRRHRGALRIAVGAAMVLGLAVAVGAKERHVKRQESHKSSHKSAAPDARKTPRSVKLPNTQMEAVKFADLDGWAADDHVVAFSTFLNSCSAILKGGKGS